MARSLTSGFLAAITAAQLRPFALLELYFDSQTLYLWNGIGPLAWDGKTYVGAGILLGSSPLTETADLKATGRQYTLQGVSPSVVSLAMTEDYQERPVREYIGAFDDAGSIIVDPYRTWTGRMDVMTPIDDGTTATIALACENIFVDLEGEDERIWSDQDQQQDYPGDRFFEYAAETEAKLVWGQSG